VRLWKWIAVFKTSNAKFNEALGLLRDKHEHFHASVRKIKELLKKGDKEAGVAIYQEEMMANAKATMEQFAVIREIAAQATNLYGKMERQAMGPAAEKFNTVSDSWIRQWKRTLRTVSIGSRMPGRTRAEPGTSPCPE